MKLVRSASDTNIRQSCVWTCQNCGNYKFGYLPYKIDIRRAKGHNVDWTICGQDNDYGLFRNIKPRELAIQLIHQVFSDKEIAERRFIYIPIVYRGRQSMQDQILVFCKKKSN